MVNGVTQELKIADSYRLRGTLGWHLLMGTDGHGKTVSLPGTSSV